MTGKSFKRQNDIGLAALKNQAKFAKTKAKVKAAKKAMADRKSAAVETKPQVKAKF